MRKIERPLTKTHPPARTSSLAPVVHEATYRQTAVPIGSPARYNLDGQEST